MCLCHDGTGTSPRRSNLDRCRPSPIVQSTRPPSDRAPSARLIESERLQGRGVIKKLSAALVYTCAAIALVGDRCVSQPTGGTRTDSGASHNHLIMASYFSAPRLGRSPHLFFRGPLVARGSWLRSWSDEVHLFQPRIGHGFALIRAIVHLQVHALLDCTRTRVSSGRTRQGWAVALWPPSQCAVKGGAANFTSTTLSTVTKPPAAGSTASTADSRAGQQAQSLLSSVHPPSTAGQLQRD